MDRTEAAVMDPDDIREWIAAAKQGDDEAFSHLVEEYQKPVYNVCYRMLGNHGDAEDAAQEAFMKAYRGLSRYDPERPFKTWLLSIASNHSIDQLRRRRFKWVGLETLVRRSESRRPSPEQLLELKSDRQDVQRALDQLSTLDRAVVVLRYWYDYSYAEIAETLSITSSAVKSRLHRSRRQLLGYWTSDEKALAEGQNEVSPA